MKTNREKKIKAAIAKYVTDENAQAEIWEVIDDVVYDERDDAKNDGIAEEVNRNDSSQWY